MISGATYRNGVAMTDQGAVYVYGLATSANATAADPAHKGKAPTYMGKKLTDQGAIYVRFV
jgi:hypothetical protein